MGEYEPDDSRIITQNTSQTPIEPMRTGPAESTTRGGAKNSTASAAKTSPSDEKENVRWQVSKNNPDGQNEVKSNLGT